MVRKIPVVSQLREVPLEIAKGKKQTETEIGRINLCYNISLFMESVQVPSIRDKHKIQILNKRNTLKHFSQLGLSIIWFGFGKSLFSSVYK